MITVFVEEEYGYRYWVWETGMGADELVAWWKGMDPSTYFISPATLPGKAVQVWDNLTHILNDMVEDKSTSLDDVHVVLSQIMARERMDNENGDDTHENIPPSDRYSWADSNGVKYDLTKMWKAHLHMKDDSWIKVPGGKKIYVGD